MMHLPFPTDLAFTVSPEGKRIVLYPPSRCKPGTLRDITANRRDDSHGNRAKREIDPTRLCVPGGIDGYKAKQRGFVRG